MTKDRVREYKAFVTSRVKSGQTIKDALTAQDVHIGHMVIGLAGEVIELAAGVREYLRLVPILPNTSRANILEESGDCFFYSVELLQTTDQDEHIARILIGGDNYAANCSISDLCPEGYTHDYHAQLQGMLEALELQVGELLDTYKRISIYRSPEYTHKDLVAPVTSLLDGVINVAWYFGFEPAQIIQSNEDKLKKRYAKKYTDAAAAARADKDGTQTASSDAKLKPREAASTTESYVPSENIILPDSPHK